MAALTTENKRQIKRLLKTGRWNNQSEILRYGLHLVLKEVGATQQDWPEPISPKAMDRSYATESAEEKALDKAACKASVANSRRAARKLAKEGFCPRGKCGRGPFQ